MKTLITILFARLVKKRNNKWISNPLETQAKTFNKLLLKGTNTEFGKDHNFFTIKNLMTGEQKELKLNQISNHLNDKSR